MKKTGELSQMCKEATEPIYITKNGYGDMVIMSMEMYEQKMLLLEAYAKLAAAEQQVLGGKMLDAGDGLKSIREMMK